MGTILDKLAYTKQAREEIRQAIVEKGVNCPGGEAFCAFDEYIRSISGGGEDDLTLIAKLIGSGKLTGGDNWSRGGGQPRFTGTFSYMYTGHVCIQGKYTIL